MDSAKFYQARMRWHITVFLLMPDHLHAVLSFARDKSMSELIRGWKRFNTRANRVMWQEGYFDHRAKMDRLVLKTRAVESSKTQDIRRRSRSLGNALRTTRSTLKLDRLLLKSMEALVWAAWLSLVAPPRRPFDIDPPQAGNSRGFLASSHLKGSN
ncbi:MAG: hypothetical protein DME51_04000 [Verrucomicrobia bacterium]|nr:MAG: hypothetical protein DME51_04000 [Verrucomicrobiota bacterium]